MEDRAMSLARIFRPIRDQAGLEARGAALAAFSTSDADWERIARIDAPSVTNMASSGSSSAPKQAPSVTPEPAAPDPEIDYEAEPKRWVPETPDEQGWMALLEIVFDEVGWPDVEDNTDPA
jgi:hypothetical protein